MLLYKLQVSIWDQWYLKLVCTLWWYSFCVIFGVRGDVCTLNQFQFNISMRPQVLSAVNIKIMLSWDARPCSVTCMYWHFKRTYCLQLQARSDGVSSMFYHCIWCHNPENHIMNPYCHVNLYLIVSHIVCKYLCWHLSNIENNWWLFAGKCCSKTKDSKACSNWEASQCNTNSFKHSAVCLSSQYVVFICLVLLVLCSYGLYCTLWPLPSKARV